MVVLIHLFTFVIDANYIVSSVRSSYSHPDLLLTQQHHHHPTFSDHTDPQHWTFTFWHTLAYSGILWHTLAYSGTLWHTLAYSGILWHTLSYSCILWHTLAY